MVGLWRVFWPISTPSHVRARPRPLSLSLRKSEPAPPPLSFFSLPGDASPANTRDPKNNARTQIQHTQTCAPHVRASLIVAPFLFASIAMQQAFAARTSGNTKGGSKVALPVCTPSNKPATTTYSCNTYGANICAIATGQCALATNADLAAVSARTDCDFLASPADKGGCGLVTREELAEFESQVADVTNALADESAAMQASLRAISATLTQISAQLPQNPATPDPGGEPLCTRQLSYGGQTRYPPFFTTGFTGWNVVPLTGGTISCKDEAVAAFLAAVTVEAAKPDSCPLVPNLASGGDYPRILARGATCTDVGPSYGRPAGKELWFQMTLSWQTRFPCPASSFGRVTASKTPGAEIFGLSGCNAGTGCEPCTAATAGLPGKDGPSGEAICNALYSAYASGTVRVTSSYTYLLRQSFCEACIAAGDPFCSPDNKNPYIV